MIESTNQHLNRAFELLKEIDFSKVISSVNWGEYSLDNGNLQCKVLFRETGAEVMHCTAQPGCKTEPHKHEQREHYLLYDGKAQMVTEDTVIDLTSDNSPNVEAGVVHWLESEKGCKMFIARIPAITEVVYG